MTERLSVTRSVTLDATGTGVISMGPGKYAENWTITRMTTHGDSALEPDLRVYRGDPGGALMLDTSARANDDVSETSLDVKHGETIAAVYSLGTPGATLTLSVEGTIRRGV